MEVRGLFHGFPEKIEVGSLSAPNSILPDMCYVCTSSLQTSGSDGIRSEGIFLLRRSGHLVCIYAHNFLSVEIVAL